MKDEGSTRGKAGWCTAAVALVIALAGLLYVYGELLSGDRGQLTIRLRDAVAMGDGG
ncbi:hypothetical protein [Rhizobium sullae]|uniref:Uncharacterized protein n=1 Tax=Rhizobium sullae TaxID=50338 RepID=A0A4R3PYX5_RHISU|nr:hypothetical protein [Rhizobium sullae]TCU04516.1 hypothetical protein EV132_13927 [Rhizobium sullae]